MASFVVQKYNQRFYIRSVPSFEEETYAWQNSEKNLILYMAACQGKVDFVLTLLDLGAEFPAIRVKDVTTVAVDGQKEDGKKEPMHAVIFDSSRTHQVLTGTPLDRRPMVLKMVKGLKAAPKSVSQYQALRRIVLMHHYLPVLYTAYVRE